MSDSITLHPTLGVNPKLTYCPRCGGEAEDLILLGNQTRIDKCTRCDIKVFGGISFRSPCPKCKNIHGHQVGTVGEGDKLPATRPCGKCRKELALHKEIVDKGGIYWKCDECGQRGVLKSSAKLCAKVRSKMKIKKPKPCGVQFNTCAQHATKGPDETKTKH